MYRSSSSSIIIVQYYQHTVIRSTIYSFLHSICVIFYTQYYDIPPKPSWQRHEGNNKKQHTERRQNNMVQRFFPEFNTLLQIQQACRLQKYVRQYSLILLGACVRGRGVCILKNYDSSSWGCISKIMTLGCMCLKKI